MKRGFAWMSWAFSAKGSPQLPPKWWSSFLFSLEWLFPQCQSEKWISFFVTESSQTNFGRRLKKKSPVNAFCFLSVFGSFYPDLATMPNFITVWFIGNNIEQNLSKPTHSFSYKPSSHLSPLSLTLSLWLLSGWWQWEYLCVLVYIEMDIHAGASTHWGPFSVLRKISSDCAVGQKVFSPGLSHAEHIPEPGSAARCWKRCLDNNTTCQDAVGYF